MDDWCNPLLVLDSSTGLATTSLGVVDAVELRIWQEQSCLVTISRQNLGEFWNASLGIPCKRFVWWTVSLSI
jgi:hypothetical protein